jgi:hypothetical protein
MKNTKKYIYYAHHLYKYNTKIEEYEINLIHRELPEYQILNPNGDIIHENLSNEEQIMHKCLLEVSRNDMLALVFSSISGVIGKGVYDEINQARSLGKKIYYIYNNTLHECNHICFNIINESRRLYAIIEKYK